MIRQGVTSSPLYWPPGWKRTEYPERSRFGRCALPSVANNTLVELDRMGVSESNVIISSNVALRLDGLPYANQKPPSDPGVSVWFSIDGEERVLACDRWDRVEHNLRAIEKHIDALRGMERWGVGSMEQAFRGYTALPAGDEPKTWREVLGIHPEERVSQELIKQRFKELAMKAHPDLGGSNEAFSELALARKRGLEAT